MGMQNQHQNKKRRTCSPHLRVKTRSVPASVVFGGSLQLHQVLKHKMKLLNYVTNVSSSGSI